MSRLVLVHPTTLLGKELRETIDRREGWTHEVRLMSSDPAEIGTVTEVGGAAAFVTRFAPEELEGVAVAFFCGPLAETRTLLEQVPVGICSVVLSPGATEKDGQPVVAGTGAPPDPDLFSLVSSHPAAIGIAHLLSALAPLGATTASVTAIQPASQRGQEGVDELYEETRAILAFTPQPPHQVFGKQLAFNLLPSPDEGALIEAAVAAALGPGAPRARVQVVHGGVFHGLALSVDVELDGPHNAREISRALARDPWIDVVRPGHLLAPTDTPSTEKIVVGEIRTGEDGRTWLWAVLDNLTVGGALNALAAAEPWLG